MSQLMSSRRYKDPEYLNEIGPKIYGGEAESQGRIVYAVPAEKLAAFLAASNVSAILR